MARKLPSKGEVYVLKVTLKDIQVPIWRTIQVRSDITLGKLHRVLLAVMGWTGSHLHQFNIGGRHYGEADPESGTTDVIDERNVKLNQVVAGEKTEFIYEYDFGDLWEHELVIEKTLPRESAKPTAVCLAGERSSPPEDCGGVSGYAEFLDAIQNSDHPQHHEMLEWVGGNFDAEAFDLGAVNRALRKIA